jgi:uncharacterized protein (TIGR02217 family)
VLYPEDKPQWRSIAEAAERAAARGTAQSFIWALPQVARDGFTIFDIEKETEAMQSFEDISFPLEIGREAMATAEFSTNIVTTLSGHEQRNSGWSDARLGYDVGPGVRSEEELSLLLAFFRARRGAAIGFRFGDPFDFSSHGMTGEPMMTDQILGVGDGVRTAFPLVKHYGDPPQIRRITRPRMGSVLVALDGDRTEDWTLSGLGIVEFATAPAAAVVVTAGYHFDVPVRFAEDRLDVSRATFGAGDMPSVPLAAIELPLLGLNDPGKPVIALFASGTDAGWRRAALSLNGAGGKVDIGVTAQPANMGSTLEPLTPHPTHVLDERGGFTVQMLNSSMDMVNRTGSPLDPDAPLIWLAGEFIRLGNCEDLGGGIYRFSRLLRGCYEFDEPVATHPTGAAFVLIEPESARLVEERAFNSGDSVEAEAFGLGDTHPATASAHIRALATTPPAPVHGELWRTGDGGVAAQWIRRSRVDNGWNDGVDQIMAEESERYRLRLFADDAPFGEWEMSVPSFLLSAEEAPFSGATTRPILTAEVVQIGRFAASKPLRLGPC